jgi:hypothetical protein
MTRPTFIEPGGLACLGEPRWHDRRVARHDDLEAAGVAIGAEGAAPPLHRGQVRFSAALHFYRPEILIRPRKNSVALRFAGTIPLRF